ncbi:MAG: RNA polymerase sigma factor SigW [Parcubacteria group bacterium GW2011_GWA1_50_14]|nr:MAG: RNA polymerase sigma factor SigW [Parcubacteria group bacterium GW2011_GWA1_50_14]
MAGKTDEEIAREVQEGGIEAFGTLVERYETKMTRYARKFLLGGEDGKDVVQEVFLKAYMNIQGFDLSKRFSPWIYRIAHNEFINAIKKRSSSPLSFFDPDLLFPHPVAEETAESEMEHKELAHLLDLGLGTLPAKYREPLVLHYLEDMDYKEIAEVLEVPMGTVGIRLMRGRALLKKMIKEKL